MKQIDKSNVALSCRQRRLMLFYRLLLAGFLVFGADRQVAAQTPIRVTGRVLASDNDAGLPGVNVSIKGTTSGSITDANGNYELSVPDQNVTLIFSFIGYVSQELTLNNRTNLTVTLIPDVKALNEVVVIAYGTQKKADVTGAVTSISASEIKDIPVTQFAQKLQGKTPGVQISQTTGVPGGGMSIRIRGAASISGSSQPLYVVDGFPIVGDISNINPDEIETFSILKDASATALYGSRASNGVVLITTKRAPNGRSTISFNASYGVQQVPQRGRPDMMNAQEFAQYENEVFQEKIRLGQATSIPVEYQNPAQYAGKGTDWYDLLLRDAAIQNYSLSLASSKEKLSTAATVGYISQNGVLLNSNYKRYSVRLNSDYKVNSKVTVGVNLAPSFATNEAPNTDGNIFGGGIIQSAIATSPLAPAINPDGTIPLTATSPGLFPNPNWYNVVQQVKNSNRTGRILANAYGTLEIIKDLNFKSSINIDYTNQQFNNFTPSTSGSLFSAPPIQTSASQLNNVFYSWLTENTLTYKRAFGNHNFDVLAGYTAQKFRQDFSNISATGFANDKVQTLNAGTQFSPSFDLQEWSLVSFVSRLNYNYKGKYLLSASFRRDGSSRFAPNTKYGNFPAVSVGWNVSDESFMTKIPAISTLKLRAGYGLNGNFNIGNYGYLARTGATNYPFNGVLFNGTTISNIGNDNLSWEKSNQLDVGLDIGLLKGRIFLTYDYFHKTTSDMLLNVGVPRQSGFATITDNVGKFEFQGHEFAVSTQNLVGRLKWSTDFNITFIKNNVLNLGPYDPALPRGDANGPNIIQIGSAIGSFFGYKFLGVYKTQADLDASPKYLGGDGPSTVGTVKYADINGDGVITVADKTIIGNPNPKFMFGMTNNLSYGNFDFSTVIAGQYGNDIQNRTLEYIQNLDGVFNVTKDVARRWKSEQDPGDGIHPRAVVSTPLARNTNSRWVSNGSYLTIKNITLGYTIPLTKNNYFKSIRAYGSVQQAFVFTSYKGANPEVNDSGTNGLTQGIDYTSYPVPRTISFGINVNLK
ncbi:TonB-dependent receptor [Dyadobacter sp. 3J3]|uniref:SusC/RagA family TonB-linked outer membrane protein n=1 Tax=Dyadobacter sp. 3J3 TaxID=2606600 RepID=UPI0013594595|nr:TonB-dependent receptor [Dyadobacter sp. 3J3]